MFTGIVQTTAIIAAASRQELLLKIALMLPETFTPGLALGASVSVNGVCLTVTDIQNAQVLFDIADETLQRITPATQVHFDIGNETLQRTTLAALEVGSEVHVERSLKMGDEIGGHVLSGHIIGIATITQIADLPGSQRSLTLTCDPAIMKYIFAKGYIALNGVSLTINDVNPHGFFTVHLIPETLKRTCFRNADVGEKINVEIDTQTLSIVDTVARILPQLETKART